jgi:hypothetical protein
MIPALKGRAKFVPTLRVEDLTRASLSLWLGLTSTEAWFLITTRHRLKSMPLSFGVVSPHAYHLH